MGFSSVSVSRVEMSLLRKCLREGDVFAPEKSRRRKCRSFFGLVPFHAGGRGEKSDNALSYFLSVVRTRGSDLQKIHARHKRNCLAASPQGLDGASRG